MLSSAVGGAALSWAALLAPTPAATAPAASAPAVPAAPAPAPRPVVFANHKAKTNSAVFVSGGREVALSDAAGRILIWDAATGRPRAELTGHSG